MNFGQIGRTTQEEATAIVNTVLEEEINLIDTGDAPTGDERNHRGSSRRWLVRHRAADYSVLQRGIEAHVFPAAQDHGLGFHA